MDDYGDDDNETYVQNMALMVTDVAVLTEDFKSHAHGTTHGHNLTSRNGSGL